MNDLDLSDLDNFVKDTGVPTGTQHYEKSLDIIKQSMGRVIQEMLITLPDGTPHMVYITKINIDPKGKVEVDFGTPSEERKDELILHVEKCITMQINDALQEMNMKKKRWFKW